jgi:hypothetical protein
MSEHNSCDNTVVGYRKFCSLTYCKHCQVFQLNIGPMTFRLEPEICDMLCEMMCGVYMHRSESKSDSTGSISITNASKHHRH